MDERVVAYFCNFDGQTSETGNDFIDRTWAGDWNIKNKETCKEILKTIQSIENITGLIENDKISQEDVLHIAVCSFLKFMNSNWDPHPEDINIDIYLGTEWPKQIDASNELVRDSEPIYVNILYPELLYLSSQLFHVLYNIDQSLLNIWWYFRTRVTHQRALEDTSATVYAELEVLIAKLHNECQNSALLASQPRLKALLYSEMCQAYLIYGRVQKAEDCLVKAKQAAGLKFELTGVLGKRTKFQQKSLPQMALTSELDASVSRPSAEESHGGSELPVDVELQDDTRLNRIQYEEDITQAELPSLEQMLCLLNVQYLQRAQPKDELLTEEVLPYVGAAVAARAGAWGVRAAALLTRCRLEAAHRRTVERAMLQAEAIVHDKAAVKNTSRLSYLWASGLPPAWAWRQQLADLYLSLGLTKAALEEYSRLRLWEDVVVCYTMLQLRHKAAEVLREQIDIAPSAKLYCLLGDATDDVTLYEKAWQFSGRRSSRARRHWGDHLFARAQYAACVPHYEASLEINSLQETVWLRLGFAALTTEQWETAARAYRRYTHLQPGSYEAWNNLAKVYAHQGDKPRAHRALIEALRYNYDNWKLWENVILLSLQTGQPDDVVRGAHRLLDLRGRYDDAPALALLVRAVTEARDSRLLKRTQELFGRITSVHPNTPELWRLYAELGGTPLLRAQRLLKAYRGYTHSGNWSSNPESTKKVIELATSLLEESLEAQEKAEDKDKAETTQQLSSARLTGQAVIRAAEKQNWEELSSQLEDLKKLFEKVTEYMKSVM